MERAYACILVLLIVTGVSLGKVEALMGDKKVATQPQPDEPKLIELSVKPATPPEPALKHLLLPDMLDTKPGNAALIYHQVMAVMAYPGLRKNDEKFRLWLDAPSEELPQDEARKVLRSYGPPLRNTELAARRESADWGLLIRTEGFNVTLPSLNRLRAMARVLAVKARLEIAEGKFGQAVRTLQTGYSMARQVATKTVLIGDLVGIAIAAIMNEQTEKFIQSEGAPNLYWALTDLPRPFIGLREGMALERSVFYLTYPRLAQVADRPLTEQEWYDITSRIWGMDDSDSGKMETPQQVLAGARKHLIARGRDRKTVEAMSADQAVSAYRMDQLAEYEHWRGEIFKWFVGLPYWQAREGMVNTEKAYEAAWDSGMKANPFAGVIPSLSRAYFQAVMLDRQIAALQCIEAVRAYAAVHDGKLPKTLGEITDTPAPLDPVTGKAFAYQADADSFTIDAPAPPHERPKAGRRYVVTVKR